MYRMGNAMKKESDIIELNTNKQISINHLLPDSPSFGGNTLVVNIDKSDKAIESLAYTERLWGKSRSQWMMKHLTCSQADPWTRLRQIGAEMSNRRKALQGAKFNYLKLQAQIEIKKEEQLEASPANCTLLNIEILETEAELQNSLGLIEGALKEVQSLSEMHESLTSTMGEINEEEFEKAQTRSHIKRALHQALWEVREVGRIKAGNQEYLEQCGISISYASKIIDEYLVQEVNVTNTTLLYDFLEKASIELEPLADIQLDILGFNPDVNLELTYDPKEK